MSTILQSRPWPGSGDAAWYGRYFCCYISYPNFAVKKDIDKKVQVTERPKDVISLWNQKENLYQLGCVFRTPSYKVNSLK